MLQAVLGFDNLLYISLESKRAPLEKQKMVRVWGIGLAVGLRICLLFLLLFMMDSFKAPWFSSDLGWMKVEMNFAAAITLFGGGFIIYTAIKEVIHMISLEEVHEGHQKKNTASVKKVVSLIVMMNVIFSFDSILSAMALTEVFWVMASAIIVSGLMMIWLSGKVSEFLRKNRMYEILGLFILFLVGVMILSEGGHDAHLKLFGYPVEAMSKSTFYFVIFVLAIVDIIQGRYQKKLLKAKKTQVEH